jgi:hypothetical protein
MDGLPTSSAEGLVGLVATAVDEEQRVSVRTFGGGGGAVRCAPEPISADAFVPELPTLHLLLVRDIARTGAAMTAPKRWRVPGGGGGRGGGIIRAIVVPEECMPAAPIM